MKKFFLWGCGGFLLFVFFASCALAITDKTDKSEPTNSKTVSSNNDSKEQKQHKIQHKIGDTVKAGDLVYKIVNVERKKVIRTRFGDEYKPGAGQYLVLELEIKNEGKEKVTVDRNMFVIKDNDGSEYTADPQVDTWINGTGSDSLGFFLKPLNPHATKKGLVAFDVPDKKNEDFTFVGQAGMFSLDKAAVINLIE